MCTFFSLWSALDLCSQRVKSEDGFTKSVLDNGSTWNFNLIKALILMEILCMLKQALVVHGIKRAKTIVNMKHLSSFSMITEIQYLHNICTMS